MCDGDGTVGELELGINAWVPNLRVLLFYDLRYEIRAGMYSRRGMFKKFKQIINTSFV